jgi:hypothetical protein
MTTAAGTESAGSPGVKSLDRCYLASLKLEASK